MNYRKNHQETKLK